MEYTAELQAANNRFLLMLMEEIILSKVMFGIVCLVALILFFLGLYKKITRRWDSLYFALLCISVLIWALCSLLALLKPDNAENYNLFSMAGIISVPALLCLHVRQQVSYKEQRFVPTAMLLLTPVFLTYLICRDLFFPMFLAALPSHDKMPWYYYAFCLYAVIALICSYILCFSVFYQMPKRTRRSTKYMLVGISAVSCMLLLEALWAGQLSEIIPKSVALDILLPLFAPVAMLVLLYSLLNALHVMPASEVIVTSREFVVGGLSTTILILNRKEEILDWNRTDWEDYPLLKPLFREPVSEYRKRMLGQNDYRVSPHSDDIIITKQGDVEKHFLLRSHEAKNSKRLFGYVLEISEVTQLYVLMRYFEQIASYDQLTGLFNRNAYINRVNAIVNERKLPLLILVGDVNMLKRINDIHGHMLGDELLSSVSDIIKKAMPENAFAARIGGDEFVLLIQNGGKEDAELFIHKTKMLCAELKHDIFGQPSISWGYALMQNTDQNYDAVFSRADAMMYEDKKSHYKFSSGGLLHNEQDIRK